MKYPFEMFLFIFMLGSIIASKYFFKQKTKQTTVDKNNNGAPKIRNKFRGN